MEVRGATARVSVSLRGSYRGGGSSGSKHFRAKIDWNTSGEGPLWMTAAAPAAAAAGVKGRRGLSVLQTSCRTSNLGRSILTAYLTCRCCHWSP